MPNHGKGDLFRGSLADLDLFNHRQLALLLHGMKHPGFSYSIRSHRTSHNASYQTGRTDLLTLADHGLLQQRKRGPAVPVSGDG